MLQKIQGVVLHQFRYGETSIIAHVYTREYGRHSFLFKGIRGKRSRIRPNLVQPFSVLNIESDIREGRDLSIVREASQAQNIHSIYYNVRKSAQALFMSEVLYHCLKEEVPNSLLYDFMVNSIAYFDTLEEGSADFHIYFLVRLSRYLGFYPLSKTNGTESVFDMKEGTFMDKIPLHDAYIDGKNSELLNDILNHDYEHLISKKLSQNGRNEMLDAVLRFYSAHIEGVTKINSYIILREIFREKF